MKSNKMSLSSQGSTRHNRQILPNPRANTLVPTILRPANSSSDNFNMEKEWPLEDEAGISKNHRNYV